MVDVEGARFLVEMVADGAVDDVDRRLATYHSHNRVAKHSVGPLLNAVVVEGAVPYVYFRAAVVA